MIEKIITEYFPLFVLIGPEANFLTAFFLVFDILKTLPFAFHFTKDRVSYDSYHIISEIFQF